MSKELNKAPVEHAGGDERDLQGAQGERDGWGPLPIVQVPWNVFDRAVMWVEDRRRYGDDGTIVDDWKALKTIQRAALAQPSPAQAEKAEVEWPEVVGQLVTWPTGQRYVGRVRERKGCKTEDVMTVAQHERIVGELRTEIAMLRSYESEWELLLNQHEQERDDALARVAELERQEPVDVPGPDEIHQMAFEEGQPAEDGDGYLFSAEEFDLFVQRLLDSCATPVARAQHSVPDGAADLCRFLAKLYCELDGLRYSTAKLPAEQIADALIFKWPVLQGARNQLNIKRISEQPYDESKLHSAIAAMLAASPGKEGV